MATFRIPDMSCGHCASKITRALEGADKDAIVEVSIPNKVVTVVSSAPDSELAEAIRQAGYSPEKFAGAQSMPARSGGGCCCGPKSPTGDTPGADASPRSSCHG